MLGFGIVLPVLGLYAQRFGADALSVGLLVASYSLAQLVSAPILRRVSDRAGRRSVLVCSLLGFAAASLLTGLAGSLTVLLAGRLIGGAAAGSHSVALGAVTDLAGPEERPRLFGHLSSAYALGIALGAVLGGLAGAWNEDAPFLVAAALACVNAVAVWARVPGSTPAGRPAVATDPFGESGATVAAEGSGGEQPAAARSGSGLRTVRRQHVGYIAVGVVAVAAFSGFEATLALLGEQRFDFTLASASAAFATIGVGLVVVRVVLVGPVTRRLGDERTVRWGLGGVAAGLAVLAAAATPAVLVVALVLLVLGHGLLIPALWTGVAMVAAAQDRGTVLRTQQTAGALARVVGPVLAGLLFDRLAPGAAYLFGAALVVVAAAVLVPVANASTGRAQGPADKVTGE